MRNGGRLSGMMPPGLCRSGRPVASCDSLRSPQALACRAPSVCREFRNPGSGIRAQARPAGRGHADDPSAAVAAAGGGRRDYRGLAGPCEPLTGGIARRRGSHLDARLPHVRPTNSGTNRPLPSTIRGAGHAKLPLIGTCPQSRSGSSKRHPSHHRPTNSPGLTI